MAYTDKAQVQNFIHRTLNDDEAALLATLIPAIKTWIDKRLNTTFDDTTPSTRYYDGGTKYLDIDPCVNITEVKAINDDGSDSYIYNQTFFYEVIYEPQNETVKREVRKRVGRFPRGVHRIAVTATFSEYDNGVPDDIAILATRLVTGVLNTGKYARTGGNLLEEALEGHLVRYQPTAGTLEGIATSDPTVCAILESRKELLVDTSGTDDEGWI